MKIGIIGLPQSGKTTFFNALTESQATTGDYSAAKDPNRAAVKVPDQRVQVLAEMFKPERVVPAEVEYVDVAGLTKGASDDRKSEAAYIAAIRQVDELVQVVRSFESHTVFHPEGSVDPKRDIETVNTELILADLVVVDKSFDKLKHQIKVAKTDEAVRHFEILEKCKEVLESESFVADLEFSEEELKFLSGFGLLTQKPMLYLLNIGEAEITKPRYGREQFSELLKPSRSFFIPICGELEMEISQLEEADRAPFMQDYGLEKSATEEVIKASYSLLGLIPFFTYAGPEVRAWTVKEGTSAVKAAGQIHSDMERGFIKAEVLPYETLHELGSIQKAKEKGALQLHGKDYIIKDGDVVMFRFNV
jgi:GTP-binding protein YchF